MMVAAVVETVPLSLIACTITARLEVAWLPWMVKVRGSVECARWGKLEKAACAHIVTYTICHMPSGPTNKLLRDYILPFLDYCEIEKGLADNTQRNYAHYLELFVRWLEKTGNANLLPHELTPKHIWDYRLYLARNYKAPNGTHLSKKSQNNYLIALRALLDF